MDRRRALLGTALLVLVVAAVGAVGLTGPAAGSADAYLRDVAAPSQVAPSVAVEARTDRGLYYRGSYARSPERLLVYREDDRVSYANTTIYATEGDTCKRHRFDDASAFRRSRERWRNSTSISGLAVRPDALTLYRWYDVGALDEPLSPLLLNGVGSVPLRATGSTTVHGRDATRYVARDGWGPRGAGSTYVDEANGTVLLDDATGAVLRANLTARLRQADDRLDAALGGSGRRVWAAYELTPDAPAPTRPDWVDHCG